MRYAEMKDATLYRHYSKDGKLLYVGVTSNLKARNTVHKSQSHWFNDIARIDTEYFENYLMAIDAESKAI
jgi:predicted GIY-YIG superfamily endonuclease